MKTALVFGSSGLVGGHLVNQLILNSNYSKIKIFVRSKIELINPKIEIIKTDFNDYLICSSLKIVSQRADNPIPKYTEINDEQLQISDWDAYCQTWIYLYSYLRFIYPKFTKEQCSLYFETFEDLENIATKIGRAHV